MRAILSTPPGAGYSVTFEVTLNGGLIQYLDISDEMMHAGGTSEYGFVPGDVLTVNVSHASNAGAAADFSLALPLLPAA